MATRTLNINKTNWTLPFRVWKKGQPHPYPGHLHTSIKRWGESIRGISFAQINSIYHRWHENGLTDIPEKPITLDAGIGKSMFSAEIDPKWLRTPEIVLKAIDEGNPFKGRVRMAWTNWFLMIYAEFAAGSLVPEKVEGKGFSSIPAISTGTVIWGRSEEEISFRHRHIICAFDWANVFLLNALYEIAREEDRLDNYRNVAGQLRAAADARIKTIDGVFDAASILGIEETMGYKNILLFTREIGKYAPQLIKWSEEGRISLVDALRRFYNKHKKEKEQIFAEIKAQCETAPDNRKANNGGI